MRIIDWSSDVCSSDLVRIAAGVIAGKLAQVDGVTLRAFHGIPYAAPPLAALRWQPPQPLPPWQGTRLAQGFGPRCMQQPLFGDMVFRASGMSEDCLYLNVWTPAQRSAEHTSELQSLMRSSSSVFCLKTTKRPTANVRVSKTINTPST